MTLLEIPAAIANQTLEHLRHKGAENAEGVVLWRGTLAPPHVTGVIVPEQITSTGRFEVPLAERQRMTRELAGTSDYIIAQVHSHPREAFHSLVDDAEAIPRRPGSYSLVVPDFARRDQLLDAAALFQLSKAGSWDEIPITAFRVVRDEASPDRAQGGLLRWLIDAVKRLGRSDT